MDKEGIVEEGESHEVTFRKAMNKYIFDSEWFMELNDLET